MHTWLYKKRRFPAWLRRNRGPQDNTPDRNDGGFSFAQVIVTMVIVGILGGAIGFTAFQFIGQSRETVLAANIRTAAEAVQNTLALNPDLRDGVDTTTGEVSEGFKGALSNAAGFDWKSGVGTEWTLDSGDGVETVHVQMILQERAAITGPPAIPAIDIREASATEAPAVDWLVDQGDAVRLQIRNDDGAWACALVVLRPDWADTASSLEVEGNLRGIWFDAGANIPGDDGLHHCSPVTVQDADLTGTAARFGIAVGADGKLPPPDDGSIWTIPHNDDGDLDTAENDDATTAGNGGTSSGDIPQRILQRTVPEFTSS